jgi:hypothetical protein
MIYFDSVLYPEPTPDTRFYGMNVPNLETLHQLMVYQIGLLEAISRANINMQISRPPMKKKMAEGNPKVKKKREKKVKQV